MVLATGSVPTEKIPSRSHEVETEKRRVLVRDTSSEPSTSIGVRSSASTTLEALLKEVQRNDVIGNLESAR